MALGDMMGLMKQAAQMQAKMQELQAELDTIEVEGTAGGGMVTVKLSAKGELKGVKIDDTLFKPAEKEIVEDLMVAAHADARRKAEAAHRTCPDAGAGRQAHVFFEARFPAFVKMRQPCCYAHEARNNKCGLARAGT